MSVKTVDLYDFTHTDAAEYLKKFEYPAPALTALKDLIIT